MFMRALRTTLLMCGATTLVMGCGSVVSPSDDVSESSSDDGDDGQDGDDGDDDDGSGGTASSGVDSVTTSGGGGEAGTGGSGGSGGKQAEGGAGGGPSRAPEDTWRTWSETAPEGVLFDALLAHESVWLTKNGANLLWTAAFDPAIGPSSLDWSTVELPTGVGGRNLLRTNDGVIAEGAGAVAIYHPTAGTWASPITQPEVAEGVNPWISEGRYGVGVDAAAERLVWAHRSGVTRSLHLQDLELGDAAFEEHDAMPFTDATQARFAWDATQKRMFALGEGAASSPKNVEPMLASFTLDEGWTVEAPPPGPVWNARMAARAGGIVIVSELGSYARAADGTWSVLGFQRQLPSVEAFEGAGGPTFVVVGGREPMGSGYGDVLATTLSVEIPASGGATTTNGPALPSARQEFALATDSTHALVLGGIAWEAGAYVQYTQGLLWVRSAP